MAELSDPVPNAAAVTPSDSTNLPEITTAIWVGTAGDVTVDMSNDGTNVTFPNLTVGWHPIRCKKIYSTGTHATGIVAVWQ
jgi:hypothetical protein